MESARVSANLVFTRKVVEGSEEGWGQKNLVGITLVSRSGSQSAVLGSEALTPVQCCCTSTMTITWVVVINSSQFSNERLPQDLLNAFHQYIYNLINLLAFHVIRWSKDNDVSLCSLYVCATDHTHHNKSFLETAGLHSHRKVFALEIELCGLGGSELELDAPEATATTNVEREWCCKGIWSLKTLFK